jgi:pimeloyl-ACP methyl ester carboxylesterase
LECPEVNEARLTVTKQNLTKSDYVKAELKAVRACRKNCRVEELIFRRIIVQQAPLTSKILRRLLNYQKWNLYGISYSTRLMLTAMRYYPDGIRSVLLDSVLPPSVNYDETSVESVMRSLNLLFNACKMDAECNAAYPNIEAEFYLLVKRLNAKPVFVKVKNLESKTEIKLLLDGKDVVNGVYSALETGYRLGSLPSLISRAEQGDNQALTSLAETKLETSGFAWGMRYSVWCTEEMPFQNRSLIKNQITVAYPKLKGFGIQSNFPVICDIWKVKPTNKIENEPVKSNIPTLILAGQYDPGTPPEWGKLAAITLTNSRFFELPGMSHIPTFGSCCAQELAVAFFDDPQSSFDSSCVGKMSQIKFELTTNK